MTDALKCLQCPLCSYHTANYHQADGAALKCLIAHLMRKRHALAYEDAKKVAVKLTQLPKRNV